MSYKVGEVSKFSGISVRTLHHYEAKGLLLPSERSDGGYRLYSDADLSRLQQILFYKTLDFSLEEIRKILCDPNFDRYQALLDQRRLMQAQQSRMQSVLNLIDETIAEMEQKKMISNSEKFAAFGNFDPQQFEEEAEQRWGDTDAYKESQRRLKKYRKEDWQTIKQESEAIITKLIQLMQQGATANDKPVLDAIEEYRLHFDRWYYPCSKSMHAQLGQMYIDDKRFFENYEKMAVGLAQFICAATQANLSAL